jgi:hypothetical protein
MGFLGVVQFMHPGNEADVRPDGWIPWNTRDHRRKFMVSSGTSVDAEDQRSRGELFFWGEWEAPAESMHRWERAPLLPSHLVAPRMPGAATPTSGLQNTDPYVFGDSFKYTLCKQVRRNGATTYLTNLEPGCLLLFGSKVQRSFVLDTVFVVAPNRRSLTRMNWESETADLSATYRHATLEPMFWGADIKDESVLSLYSGASLGSETHGMFSFVPCIRASVNPLRFARPNIVIDGVINQELMMGTKRTEMSVDSVNSIWAEVKTQVQASNLDLGVLFDEPEQTAVPEECWPH